jgi:Fur family ferric uptake transcriptional regulator
MMEEMHDFNITGHSLHFFGKCDNVSQCGRRTEIETKKRAAVN